MNKHMKLTTFGTKWYIQGDKENEYMEAQQWQVNMAVELTNKISKKDVLDMGSLHLEVKEKHFQFEYRMYRIPVHAEYEIVLKNVDTGKTRLVYKVELNAPEHKGLSNEKSVLESLGITTCKRKNRDDDAKGENTSF